jgi:bis(5'-adenosyl)-triphosphatase
MFQFHFVVQMKGRSIMNCAFCTRGPSQVIPGLVLSSTHYYVLYNLRPVVPGHVLLIPHAHVESQHDGVPPAWGTDFMTVLNRTARGLMAQYRTDSYNVILQCGRDSGMSVPHLHWHIVPRHREDALTSIHVAADDSTLNTHTTHSAEASRSNDADADDSKRRTDDWYGRFREAEHHPSRRTLTEDERNREAQTLLTFILQQEQLLDQHQQRHSA